MEMRFTPGTAQDKGAHDVSRLVDAVHSGLEDWLTVGCARVVQQGSANR